MFTNSPKKKSDTQVESSNNIDFQSASSSSFVKKNKKRRPLKNSVKYPLYLIGSSSIGFLIPYLMQVNLKSKEGIMGGSALTASFMGFMGAPGIGWKSFFGAMIALISAFILKN